MTLRRVIVAAAVLCLLVVLACCGVGAGFFATDGSTMNAAFGSGCGHTGDLDPAGKLPSIKDLADDQVRNAATIIQVGQQMLVPPRGWVIAIATALQESTLRNLGDLGTHNDHDSLGLFQQRPSQGWGTPAQIMDPAYASRKFYEHLVAIPGWEQLALTDAAQRVQRSAYPDAYAKHEPLAAAIVDALTGGAGRAAGGGDPTKLVCAGGGAISAGGWTVPVPGKIVSGFRSPSRPDHFGVDLAADKNTPIHAASAGTVRTVTCNASLNGQPYSCDQDGSEAVKGCGWYVDIEHAAGVITRYCHQIHRPDVVPGQQVTAGQVIGDSGTSGNSSGPHVHFEVHLNGDSSNKGAVDPVPWMKDRGAPLGQPGPP